MAKITLNNVVSVQNTSVINDNFQKIATQLNDLVFYRDVPTGEPNQLDNPLDANGERIYNLPEPVNDHEAATLQTVKNHGVGGQYGNTLRTPDPVVVLPNAAGRANRLLSFDASGQPQVLFPSNDSATQLRIDLQSGFGTDLVGNSTFSVADYTELRTYAGNKKFVVVQDKDQNGQFVRDDVDNTYADDGGILIVDASNRRWKRINSSPVRFEWYGAKGDGVTDDSVIISQVLNSVKGPVLISSNRSFVIGGLVTTLNKDFTGIYGEDENTSKLLFTGVGKMQVFSELIELPGISVGTPVSNSNVITLSSAPSNVDNGDVVVIWNTEDGSFSPARPDYHDGCMNQVYKVVGSEIHTYGRVSEINESSLRVFLLKRIPFKMERFSFAAATLAYPAIHIKHRVGVVCNSVSTSNAGNDLGIDFDKCFDVNIHAGSLSGNSGNAYPFHLVNSQNVRVYAGSNRSIRHATGIGGNQETACVPPRDITLTGLHLYNNTVDAPAPVGVADIHGGSENIKYIGCVLHSGAGVNGRNIKYSDCDIHSYQGGSGYVGSGTEVAGGELSFTNCRLHIYRSSVEGSGSIFNLGLENLTKDLTVKLNNIHIKYLDSTGNTVFPIIRMTPNSTSSKITVDISGITTEGVSPKYAALVSLPSAIGVPTHNSGVKVSIRDIDEGRFASYAPTTGESAFTLWRITGYGMRATTALVSGTDTSTVTLTPPMSYPKLPSVYVSAYDNPGSANGWIPLGRSTPTNIIVYTYRQTPGNVFTGNLNLGINTELKEF